LKPVLPLRLIECRAEYSAKVMQNTIWNRLAAWGKDKLEDGFEEGASIQIKLSTGETIPAEVRVFKILNKDDPDQDAPQTGLRALLMGSLTLSATPSSSRTSLSILNTSQADVVTLDCTDLVRPRGTRFS